jgi:hypothetical protein
MDSAADEQGEVSAIVDELHERATALGEREDALAHVFPPAFVQRHTEFESFEAFMRASEWDVSSREEFAAIPQAEFDAYVAEHSSFADWEEMLGQAGEAWMARQLGL